MSRKDIRSFDRFLDEIGAGREIEVTAVLHQTDKDGHIHAAVLSDSAITKAEVDRAWARHFPAKGAKEYHLKLTYLAPATNLRKLLFYFLLGTDEKLRTTPPWYGLPLKCPYITRSRKRSGSNFGPHEVTLPAPPRIAPAPVMTYIMIRNRWTTTPAG